MANRIILYLYDFIIFWLKFADHKFGCITVDYVIANNNSSGLFFCEIVDKAKHIYSWKSATLYKRFLELNFIKGCKLILKVLNNIIIIQGTLNEKLASKNTKATSRCAVENEDDCFSTNFHFEFSMGLWSENSFHLDKKKPRSDLFFKALIFCCLDSNALKNGRSRTRDAYYVFVIIRPIPWYDWVTWIDPWVWFS